MNLNSVSGLIGRAMPHDRDSPHHTPYKDSHHIRGSISQGNSQSFSKHWFTKNSWENLEKCLSCNVLRVINHTAHSGAQHFTDYCLVIFLTLLRHKWKYSCFAFADI